MRPQSSLVKRLTLMFMFAVTAVLVVAGVAFYGLSQHHFRMLDEQALAEKLESTRHVLSISAARGELDDQEQQLRALLGAHQDLSAKITKADGTVLFQTPKPPKSLSGSSRRARVRFGNGRMKRRTSAVSPPS